MKNAFSSTDISIQPSEEMLAHLVSFEQTTHEGNQKWSPIKSAEHLQHALHRPCI